jgi:hypothetical protein
MHEAAAAILFCHLLLFVNLAQEQSMVSSREKINLRDLGASYHVQLRIPSQKLHQLAR